ncbi:MAG: AmmeMemoRadiSam system protein A [Firmicutes bacterium]|nr:AmmeMemoRadiSam system protein A [Bacillota bacterium]
MLTYGAFVPHPAIILEEVGGEETKKVAQTVQAMKSLRERIEASQPETILLFSPHGPVFQDGLAIRGGKRLRGSLANFGFNRRWEWENDQELVQAMIEAASEEGLNCREINEEFLFRYRFSRELDHGVLVPLAFLAPEKVRLVATGMSLLPWLEQYKLGRAIGRAVRNSPRRIAVIASGDLSHCLFPGAPVAYDPHGEEFDRRLVNILKEKKIIDLFRLSPELVEKAAECGFRTLLMLLGVFDGLEFDPEVLSYEGPFGVGYLVSAFEPRTDYDPDRSIYSVLLDQSKAEIRRRRRQESPLVQLARRTVENHLLGTEEEIELSLPPEAQKPAGVFVSIKKHGNLRGCIGTIFPTQPSAAEEIRHNAIAAAFQDPRFDPVQVDELDDLVYSVDLLQAPEPISGPEELDPERYGVIVRRGGRTGLLLPNLEGVDTVEKQIAIAKQKAGIGPKEEVEMERFEVIRYF